MADQEQLRVLTADIVAAHVSNNTVALSEIGVLVQRVHEALSGLGTEPPAAADEKRTPVVSARASVRPDYLICMQCGKKQKTLKRHLQTAHGLSPQEYRGEFGLPDTYPMVAASYSQQRQEMARAIGLGRRSSMTKPKARGRKAVTA